METWKDIEGYENKYQISSEGRLRSMPRYVRGRNGSTRRLPMQVLELTKEQVLSVRGQLAEGKHPYSIAEEMGISRKVVSKIKAGRSYAWLN